MHTTARLLTVALCSSLALAGCEKAGSKASGPLGAEDLSLLHDLPGGNVALFGGNYMKMQDFMHSMLGHATSELITKATGDAHGFKAWMACFTKIKQLRIAGAFTLAPGAEARIAFRGMTIEQIDGCAKQAGYGHTLDADHKFVAVEVPGPGGVTLTQGYLALPDGAIYNRQRFTLEGMPSVHPASRSDLEADAARFATSNAAGDKALVALAAKTDRSKTVWFAGSAANTPAAAKLGDVYGTVDFAHGLKLDVFVGFNDPAMAKQVEDGLAQARKAAGSMPPELRSVVDGVELHRDGNAVHMVASMDDAQIHAIMKLANSRRY